MPLPDRPVAAAAIETEWGQAVHDYTFAPAGTSVYGGALTVSTLSTLLLQYVDDDPGGWADTANRRVIVPTGHEGLYAVSASYSTVNGDAGGVVRIWLRVNGSNINTDSLLSDGGINVFGSMMTIEQLAAGDIIDIKGELRTGGTHPQLTVRGLRTVRLGAELGA
jgi:hypothetical protein